MDGDRALVADEGFPPAILAMDLVTGDRTIFSDADTGTGTELTRPFAILIDVERALVMDADMPALFSIELATGERSILADDSRGTGPTFRDAGRIAAQDGRAFVVDAALAAIVSVDLATGERSILSDATTGSGRPFSVPRDIAVESGRAYVIDQLGPGMPASIFSVDTTNGDRAVVSDGRVGLGHPFCDPAHLALDGERLLVTDCNGVIAVDIASGDRSVVSGLEHGEPLGLLRGIAVDGSRALVVSFGDVAGSGVVAVDLTSGERTILSGEDGGQGPTFVLPTGIAIAGERPRVQVRVGRTVRSRRPFPRSSAGPRARAAGTPSPPSPPDRRGRSGSPCRSRGPSSIP